MLFILQTWLTALMLASKGGHTEVVLLLLEHLAEINVVTVVGCVLLLSQQRFVHLMKTSKEMVESLKAMSLVGSHLIKVL